MCAARLGHDLHDNEIAKVTISENSTVMAMMMRVIGSVDVNELLQALARDRRPLVELLGTDLRPARYMIRRTARRTTR